MAAALANASSPFALLHRDFHDKQVFITDAGVGLIDFDTLACGEPALDLGNAIAHFQLRMLQGYCTAAQAAAATSALLAGYHPTAEVRRRLDAYVDAALLRLVCVYAFRPGWRHVGPALLDRIGHPIEA